MISAAGTVLRSYDSREISYSESIQELSPDVVSAESHQPAPKSSSGSEGRNKAFNCYE